MSIRADHYDTASGFQSIERTLPIAYSDRHQADTAVRTLHSTVHLCENEAHAYIRQAIFEQKTLAIRMADGLSVVTFSGLGSDLLIEHSYGSRHQGTHALCVGSWVVWEIFRGCPSKTLGELLTYLPCLDTPRLQPTG
ncbi:MAG: hypothetical protein ABW223_06225 [Rariglobus sp.]